MKTDTLHADIVIVGAGLVGSAIAMGLSNLGVGQVLVVDLDLSGEWSSSELNAGGVRATWSQKVNLLTSKMSIEYYDSIRDQVGYRDCGYLWMHRSDTFKQALKTRKMHIAHGWPVEILDRDGIRSRYPFIDKTDDLEGALLGTRDGLINPNRLKEHYREKAIEKGVRFLDGVFVLSSDGKKIEAFQFLETLSSEKKRAILCKNPKSFDALTEYSGKKLTLHADTVVNAAGAWAPEIAKILNYTCPSVPVRRQISMFHTRDLDLSPYGMMIDPSGVYFHPESIYGLSGFATPSEPAGFNFHYNGESFFEEQIWAHLFERARAFESLKHVSGWAGLYENSPDHHAIVGEVRSASGLRIFEAHSFSGHGAMQSYGVGVALAEKIVKGKYLTLDLTELSGERFENGRTIEGESWII